MSVYACGYVCPQCGGTYRLSVIDAQRSSDPTRTHQMPASHRVAWSAARVLLCLCEGSTFILGEVRESIQLHQADRLIHVPAAFQL